MKFVFILFMAVLCHSSQNYQDRIIYYNERDNVCSQGEQSDTLKLTLTINFNETIKIEAGGSTMCDMWKMRCAEQIHPLKSWSTFINIERSYDVISFNEETEKTFMYGELIKLRQRSTVENPVTIDGEIYQCEIQGSGKEEHFGQVPVFVVCVSHGYEGLIKSE